MLSFSAEEMMGCGATVEEAFSRLSLLLTPSRLVPLPWVVANVVPDHCLADGRKTTDGWSGVGPGLAQAPETPAGTWNIYLHVCNWF